MRVGIRQSKQRMVPDAADAPSAARGSAETWRYLNRAPARWLLWGATGAVGVAVWYALRNLTRHPAGEWSAGISLLGAVLALAGMLLLARRAEPEPFSARTMPEWVREVSPPGVVLGVALLFTLVATVRRWDVENDAAGWDIAAPWLLGVVLAGVAAWWPVLRRFPGWSATWVRVRRLRPDARWLPWIGLVLLAGLPRLILLDRYPSMIDGDESQFLMMAVSAGDGTMTNPFGTGWVDIPHLYPALEGWLARMAGNELAGYRLTSGLVGIIGVLATWRLGRWLVGAGPALVGAGLMATMPFHLFFSRSALSNVTDPTVLALGLLFLWRAIVTGRRGEVFVCGVVLGLGWYGYWGARVFPLIVAVLIGLSMLDRRVGWRGGWRLGLWSALGFVVTAGPLLMTFVMRPEALNSRMGATSIGAASPEVSGWSAWWLSYRGNLREVVFLPAIENVRLFYRHGAPFVGWPMVLLLTLGLAVLLATMVRSRAWLQCAWLVVPWAVISLGVALTLPVQSQRLVALIPIWALLAGCGVAGVVRWLTTLPMPHRDVIQRVLAAAMVLVLGWANLRWMMDDDRLFETWGDARTLAAWDIAWRLSQDASSATAAPEVLMAGAPVMFLNDWGSVAFLAPEATVIDLDGEDLDDQLRDGLPPNAVLLLVPLGATDACSVVARIPGITLAEVRAHDGQLLYEMVYQQVPAGWSMATSPERTSMAEVAFPPCGPPSG